MSESEIEFLATAAILYSQYLHSVSTQHLTGSNCSSYSTVALEFEKVHQIAPVFNSPRMSRRSLRLQTTGGLYGNDSLADFSSQNHSSGGSKLYLIKLFPLVCVFPPGRSSRTDHSSTGANGGVNTVSHSHAMVANGYICNDCSIHSERKEALTTYSSSSSSQAASAAAAAASFSSSSSSQAPSAAAAAAALSSSSSSQAASAAAAAAAFSSSSSQAASAAAVSSSSASFSSLYCTDKSDDCKGKQHLETNTRVHSYTQTSKTHRLLGGLWALIVYTGLALGSAVGSAVRSVAQRLVSVLWLVLGAPGKAARRLLWCLGTGWYQLPPLLSLRASLNLCLYCANMVLHEIHLPRECWTKTIFLVLSLTSHYTSVSLLYFCLSRISLQPVLPPIVTMDTESLERVEQVEHGLALLWERVQQGDQRQEQRHGDSLAQYTLLREQLDSQKDRDSLGLWVSGLLEHRITLLRGELEQQEASHRAQVGMAVRVGERDWASVTETLLPLSPFISLAFSFLHLSVGVDQEAHAALLAEVQRLEGELGRIRGDLQGVMGCQGKCEQLNTIQETVSAQVRRDLRALFYGSDDQTHQGEPDIPEVLLQWLSSRYVSGADLQALLASLELSILRNVSLQLEQSRAEARAEAITQSVHHTAMGGGLSEEQVQLIVQNALKLYSQDRTGLVDYALESGGGSILSTRCSETYETKTALMSLFSVPLWYFSQSPRVAIQPDVYPGNCWAFKGSHGYLVIRLSLRILPTAFCLEHIPKALSPTGNITSAPRNFTVYGLDDEYQEEGKLLGQYTYQEDGDSMQNFPVMEKNERAFQIIEVRVLTNWGHPEYTCLYRFRVHGEPRIQ
uniref:Sad1 and UNC84 domain containing 1b n=1 Tax=Hucho hucho TaxID=62062 RepID=A0A4W5RJR5_9TELE